MHGRGLQRGLRAGTVIDTLSRTVPVIYEAFRVATQGEPGPVFVEIPVNLQLMPGDAGERPAFTPAPQAGHRAGRDPDRDLRGLLVRAVPTTCFALFVCRCPMKCQCTGTEVACNDDADSRTTSVLRLTSLAAGTYTQEWSTHGAMLRSSDRGKTWQVTPMPFKMGGNENGRSNGERLAIDPHARVTVMLDRAAASKLA